MKRAMGLVLLLATAVAVAGGCGLVGMWRAIPPPGGCDRCHKLAINNDWNVTITAVQLSSEDGKPSWQKEGSVTPAPNRPLEQQMLEEERCFRCHREPEASHREYRGRYHH